MERTGTSRWGFQRLEKRRNGVFFLEHLGTLEFLTKRMNPEPFDAIVVGSGATGGLAAKEFCEGGLKVLVIEAGAAYQSTSHGNIVRKGGASLTQKIQSQCSAFNSNTQPLFVDDVRNPYLTPVERPFSWIRSRAVGGRTLLWAGQSYRMSDYDFKAAGSDGVSENWPITYRDLSPYYDRAERLLKVRGTCEGLPQLPDGCFEPFGIKNGGSQHLRNSWARMGRAVVPARVSCRDHTTTTGSPCVHCGRTDGDCWMPVDSTNSSLADAFKTGHLTLLTNSPVREILTDVNARATGVRVINSETKSHRDIKARLIFLCASTLESTRIMLNSTSRIFPNGLANSSGVLGHYVMDHVFGVRVTGLLRNAGLDPGDHSLRRFYVPRWQNIAAQHSRSFVRGYGLQMTMMPANYLRRHSIFICGGARPRPALNMRLAELRDLLFRRQAGREKAAIVTLEAFGEMLPHYGNRVEIDQEGGIDSCQIPIIKVDCQHGENEAAMARNMFTSAVEMFDAAGVELLNSRRLPYEPGRCIHEAGTCRMGKDPKKAVLNEFNQCHDVPNVFVTDGGCFPSQGTQNPTLTMMALTLRACEYAIQQGKRGEL